MEKTGALETLCEKEIKLASPSGLPGFVSRFTNQKGISMSITVSGAYGEAGWDVICDYTVNLEPYLVETLKLIDKLCDEWTKS